MGLLSGQPFSSHSTYEQYYIGGRAYRIIRQTCDECGGHYFLTLAMRVSLNRQVAGDLLEQRWRIRCDELFQKLKYRSKCPHCGHEHGVLKQGWWRLLKKDRLLGERSLTVEQYLAFSLEYSDAANMPAAIVSNAPVPDRSIDGLIGADGWPLAGAEEMNVRTGLLGMGAYEAAEL